MLRKSAVVALMVTSALALPGWAQEQEKERTIPLRSFDRFELDSEAVNGLWAEAGTLLEKKKDPAPGGRIETDAKTAFARLAYGGNDSWEADLLVPYHFVDADLKAGGGESDFASGEGIGDVQLSGKYVPIRGKVMDLGIGGLLSLPSGDDKKGFGAGELGGMPFVTGTMHVAVAELRAHVGAEFFTGSSHGGQATDRIVYGFDLIAPLCKYASLRNEFSGTNFRDLPNSPKAVSYLPGLDIRVPIGGWDVLLRPTGLIGITSQAPDWGFGGSVVIASPTMRAPAGAAGPGGVVVE
jgi:hypothetical protein